MNGKRLLIIGIILLFIAIVTTIFIIIFTKGKEEEPKKEENKQTEPINVELEYNLNLDFLKLEYKNNNVLYSPLSIKKGLDLLKEGANNDTLTQLTKISDNSNYKITDVKEKIGISNAIFVHETYKNVINKDYITNLQKKYNSNVFYDNFNTPNTVNDYVKEKTFNMIPKLFDNLSGSKVVLVNALAIDLDWTYNFDYESTYKRTFYGNKETKVDMMSNVFKNNNIKYYKDQNINMISLPLETIEGTSLEYIAIMPNDLNSYISALKLETLNKDIDKLISGKNKYVKVLLPKYKINYELNFKSDLLELGLTDMFDPNKADFTKISDTGLYIDQAKHKAVFETSEKGIKAAAATGFTMKENAMIEEKKPDIEIEFNKPFIYLVRDTKTKTIWFVGTLVNPNSGDKNES